MIPRALLLVLTTFWLTMNVLLWRAEYGAQPGLGSSVPAELVWQKMLTAPDSSSLTIFQSGKKIGFCHWITSVGEELSRMRASDVPPEGMVHKIVNYRLELDGNVALSGTAERLRFDTHLTLNADRQWQEFNVRLNLRPSIWEVHSTNAQKSARLSWQDNTGRFDRVFRFQELENPDALLKEFADPTTAAVLSGLGLSSLTRAKGGIALRWEARHESIRLGHSFVRAYRLQAHLFDRFSAVIFISRAGEILRAELPSGITLTNDQLGGN